MDEKNKSRKNIVTKLKPPTINPFINKTTRLSPYEYLKIVTGIILVPLRIILFLLLLLPATILAKIVTFGLTEEQISKHPLSEKRQAILAPIRYLGRSMLFVLGVYWIDVRGKPAPSASVFVSNHISFIDPLYYCGAILPHFVAKGDTAKVPLIGSIVKAMQLILVDRLSPTSRVDVLNEIKRRAKWTESPTWRPITIFPEGTCTNGNVLIAFKSGAFSPGVPVQPVVIRYPFVHFDVSFVNGSSSLVLFLRMLSQFVIHMEVEYLPIYLPNEAEKANPILYGNNVRAVMAEALNITTTDHTYEDVLLQMEAMKRNLSPNQVILMNTVKKEFASLSVDDMRHQLRQFTKMDKHETGVLNLEQFRSALGLPESKLVEELFNMLDVDGSGGIDFREYIAGCAMISSELTNDESLKMAFDAFDITHEGKITVSQLEQVMTHAFPAITSAEVTDLFESIDRDQPDKVSYDEFAAHLKKHPEYLAMFFAFKNRAKEDIITPESASSSKKDQ